MFLPNVPGVTFIPGTMSIPESRVCRTFEVAPKNLGKPHERWSLAGVKA